MNRKLLVFVICFFTFSFANAQLNSVAVVGDGAGGWPANTPGEVDFHQMTTTDGVNWTLNNLTLTIGSVKFRGNNSWNAPYDWGGAALSSGTAVVQGPSITSNPGVYNLSFNSTTLAYKFEKQIQGFQIISILGDATPGKWNFDTDMTTTDGTIYTLNSVSLTSGALKFRGDHSWTLPYNWGGTAFPSGTSVVDADGITIPTAGTYTITFNKTSMAYSITSTLGVNDFDALDFKAYPNPTQSNWTFSSAIENIESIVITNTTGQTVKTVTPKSNHATIDASALTAGIYFAKVTTATASQTMKLIKQ